MKKLVIAILLVITICCVCVACGKTNNSNLQTTNISNFSENTSLTETSLKSITNKPSLPMQSTNTSTSSFSSGSSIQELSNDTYLKITSVCGVLVANNKISITKTEWQNLLNQKNDLLSYTIYVLADRATIQVSFNETLKTINYMVTAEDGITTKEYVVEISVLLSSDTDVVVNKVCNENVYDNSVKLNLADWNILCDNYQNVKPYLTASLPSGASYTATFNKDNGKIILNVVAEDGKTTTKEVVALVNNIFGEYVNGLGTKTGFVWNNQESAYITNYENSSSVACGVCLNDSTICNEYFVNFKVELFNLTSGATLSLIARKSDNVRVRFIVKAISSTEIEIASDYNDGYKDLDYTIHVASFKYTNSFKLGLVVKGKDVAMLYNDNIVYHRGIEGLLNSQMLVETTNSLGVKILDYQTIDQLLVEEKYTNVTKNYRDPLVGKTLGYTNNINKCEQDLLSGTVRINQSNTNTEIPLVSFMNNGNPVAGYSFAVMGNVKVETVVGKSGHIGFMCYQDVNNSLRYIINRNDNTKDNSVYYRYNVNGTWTPTSGNTLCPNTKNILTGGTTWIVPFHFIFDEGKVILYLEGKHIMTYQSEWGYCNAIIEVIQNADVTYSNLYATTNSQKVKEILAGLQQEKTISFGQYGDNKGNANNFINNTSLGGYATNIVSGQTYYDSGVYLNNSILSGEYYMYTAVDIPTLKTNGEFVISAYSRNNKQIRYILRAVNATQIELASDYRDDGAYLNYMVHVPAFTYSSTINLGIIVNGNHVAMIYNGQTIYHRALENFNTSQMVIASANSMQAVLKNIQLENNATQVENLYSLAMEKYKDILVGNTIGNTNNLNKCTQDLANGTVNVDMANQTSGGPMVSFYNSGNPVAGYSFAVSGKITAVTVSGKSGHIGFMCYSNDNNWSRFIINRISGNNSCYYRYKDNGVAFPASGNQLSTYAKNTLQEGLTWVADFTFIYDSGYIALYIEDKLMMKMQTEWGLANAILEVTQNVNVTLSNLTATNNPIKVEEIRKEIEQISALANNFTQNTVWSVNQDLSFVKNNYNYQKASLALNGNEVISNAFYVKATIGILEPISYGQAEILICNASNVGFRYVLEYLPDGTYQIFTQKVNGNTLSDWVLVASKVNREINCGIIVVDGKITFFVNNVKKHEYTFEDTVKIYLGGEKCIVRVKNILINTNKKDAQNLVVGLKEDEYVSNYLSRAQSIASSYAGEPTGQTLLMGSSSIDLWKERLDSNGNKVAGYLADLHDLPDNDKNGVPDVLNVGIGGTTYKDWLSFYDILVKPFLPATDIVLYCGANDVYGGGSAEDTFANYKKLVEKILADSPNSKIYYVRTNPSKTLYGTNGSGAVWQRLTAYENMVTDLANTTTNLIVIDMVNELKDANGPKASLWDADGTHLNREGYQVWASYVRKAMGLDE